MKKILPFLLLVLLTGEAFSQQKIQISIGGIIAQQEPSIRLSFSASENLEFFKYEASAATISILLTDELDPRIGLRYGFELRRSPIESTMRLEISGQPQDIFYQHDMYDINLPVDIVHYPKKWFYVLGGIYPTFRIEWNSYSNNSSQSTSSSIAQQRQEIIDQLKDHISFFGFNYRLGLGFRYKPVGIEFTYENLLTNYLEDEFTFGQNTLPTKLKYSSFFIRLVFHFVKPIGTLLDWDMNY
ncbi:MAG: hypothetical protein OXH57_04730 [Ekhidna sp.]|nr:hypothetical protein [Ekhidna sp.]